MSFKNTKQKVYNSLYVDVIHTLLDKIYNIRISGYKYEFVEIFSINDNVIMSKVISDNNNNIQLIIIELDFLKNISKNAIINNLYTYCAECGEVHAQHKYKSCGHYVNYLCAYSSLNDGNSCRLCEKQIKPIKLILNTSKKKDTCSICLEDCNKQLSTCGHYFHKQCIDLHTKKSNKCPMCRQQLHKTFFKKEQFNNTKFSLGNNREGLVDIFIKKYV